jgi:hypothetical protein
LTQQTASSVVSAVSSVVDESGLDVASVLRNCLCGTVAWLASVDPLQGNWFAPRSGLRIRRQGVRRLEGFWGHCWQSALFPGGRAFGYIAYPPRPDGQPTFNEGYLFDGGGDLIPARVVEAPWLTRLRPRGEDVSVVLETAKGSEPITGETMVSTHDITDPSEVPAEELAKMASWTFLALQQAGVRYRWDGEETFGMIERSSPMHKIRL